MNVHKTCFLIDDDVDDQEIFTIALQQVDPNFHCITAGNGDEALKMLIHPAAELPDYIFLDLNMPRMNGKECLRELKKLDRLKHIPVVIYTTSSSEYDQLTTRTLGAASFITKPFTIAELVAALHAFFKTSNGLLQDKFSLSEMSNPATSLIKKGRR
jgi:DNA-binding response OmpR family regulator